MNVVFLERPINVLLYGSHYKATIISIIILIFFLVFCCCLLIRISIRIRLFPFPQLILFVWNSWKRIDVETRLHFLVDIYCYTRFFNTIAVCSFNNILVCIFSDFFFKMTHNIILIIYTLLLLFVYAVTILMTYAFQDIW